MPKQEWAPSEAQRKYWDSMKGIKGDKAPNYRQNPTKSAVHHWMNANYGKPKKCDDCGIADENKIYDWANIGHTYKRVREDFKRLCRSCHRKLDGVIPPSRLGKKQSDSAKDMIRKFALKRKRTKARFL